MGLLFALFAFALLMFLGLGLLGVASGFKDHWPAVAWRGGAMILVIVLWWILHQNRIFRYKK